MHTQAVVRTPGGLYLYLLEPRPTRRTITPSLPIALALYPPRITTGVLRRASWVVDGWTGWAMVTFNGAEAWPQVVAHMDGAAGPLSTWFWAVLSLSLRDSLLSTAGRGGWGVGPARRPVRYKALYT